MWNGRRINRLLLCWSASLLTVSFVSLWMGHAALLQLDISHDDHFFLKDSNTKSLTPTFWNRITREKIQNRTVAAKNKCRDHEDEHHHHQLLLLLLLSLRRGEFFVSNYKQCRYPPRHECEREKYSILFHVQERNVRTLFINILKTLALPRVVSIHVIMLENGTMAASLQKDVKYGHRILNWHENHRITIHVGRLPEFHGDAQALLLFNGDIPHVVGNRRDLELGFQLWKRNANALVARRTWSLKKKKKKQSNTFHHVTTTHESFVTVCNNESLELTTTTTMTTKNQQQQQQQQDEQHDASLVDPSGLWLHSNFLCIVKPFLLIKTKENSWWTRLIVVLMQVAQGPVIHLYPARLPITNDGLTIQEDDSFWIDLKVLNELVHEFGGIPALQQITWCAGHDTTTGEEPRLCDPTSIAAENNDFTTFQC